MAGNTKRQQAREAESQVNTRQDRNTFISDGGAWSWDATLEELSWDAQIRVWRAGIGYDTITAGNVPGIAAAGDIVYLDVDRASTGALTLTKGTLGDPTNIVDNRIILGVRGSDNKFYMRDGTIFSDGDIKTLGTLNAVTARTDITANGNAEQNVGFTYVPTTDQLVVYVGGILQTKGVHYTEAPSDTQVTFEPAHIPSPGEDISFVNVVGGQGPSGLGNLQDVVIANPVVDIDLAPGPVLLYDSSFAPNFSGPVLQWGEGPNPADLRGQLLKDGHIFLQGSPTLADLRAGMLFRDGTFVDWWYLIPEDGGTGDILLYNDGAGGGIRLKKDGSGLEFGSYGGIFPASSWSGDGAIRWTVIQGTLDAAGAGGRHEIPTGLSSMVGALFMIYDGNQSTNLVSEFGGGTFTNKQHAVMIDNAAQQVEIWATPSIPDLSTKAHILGEAYTLIVFHQG